MSRPEVRRIVFAVLIGAAGCVAAGCSFDESVRDFRCDVPGAQRGDRICRDGRWVLPADAEVDTSIDAGVDTAEPPTCEEGSRRETERTCGSADRGTWRQICRDGRWVDAKCVGGWYDSCDAYLEAHPDAETGTYRLDIDGRGDRQPQEARCLMNQHGWTLVAADDFEEDAYGWSPSARSDCGAWGTILGGPCTFGDGRAFASFEIAPVEHTHAMLRLHYLQIDSWDGGAGDTAWAALNGTEIWSETFSGEEGAQRCGQDGPSMKDQRVGVSGRIEHSGRQFRVTAGATLDQFYCDESWGIDNVRVYVR